MGCTTSSSASPAATTSSSASLAATTFKDERYIEQRIAQAEHKRAIGPSECLSQAITSAENNTVITLKEGKYMLASSTEVTKSVILLGQGPVVVQGQDLLEVSEDGIEVILRDIKFDVPKDDKDMGASSLVVRGGTLIALRCRFSSAGEHGVELSNTAIAFLDSCVIKNCRKNGVDAGLNTKCFLRACLLSGSGDHGLRASEDTTIDLVNCALHDNLRDGCDVSGKCCLSMVGCVLVGNKDSALFSCEDASVTVHSTVMAHNAVYGLHLSSDLPPKLNDIECYDNKESNVGQTDASLLANVCETKGPISMALAEHKHLAHLLSSIPKSK